MRRAIELALSGEVDDEVLHDVEVHDVVPTPDPGRLQVVFAAGETAAGRARSEVLTRLEQARPAMVREIAASIHRRKLPQLAFDVIRRNDSGYLDPTDTSPLPER